MFVPALFVWRAMLVPDAVDALRRERDAAVERVRLQPRRCEDGRPLLHGFPSYWNIVVFYMLVLRMPPAVNGAILLGLAVMVFVPIRYVYPSRTTVLRWPTIVLGAIWGVLMLRDAVAVPGDFTTGADRVAGVPRVLLRAVVCFAFQQEVTEGTEGTVFTRETEERRRSLTGHEGHEITRGTGRSMGRRRRLSARVDAPTNRTPISVRLRCSVPPVRSVASVPSVSQITSGAPLTPASGLRRRYCAGGLRRRVSCKSWRWGGRRRDRS